MLSVLAPAFFLLAFQRGTTLDAELGAELQATLDAYIAAGKAPGVSAGVVTAEGRELALAAGLADREKKTALRPDDRLCAGSCGKTFVAAVGLQLVEEGELRLEQLLGEFLGEEAWFERLPNAADITIAQLFEHRTGLARYEFQPEFAKALREDPDRVWKPAELVAFVLDRSPPFAAGAGFAYSDTNFILLGMVIERITGKTLYVEVERRLLGPLGLAGVRAQDSRALPGLVQGYLEPNDPFIASERTLLSDGRFAINPQFEWAGGGFIANGGALARWAKALHEGPVLKPETRARMTTGLEARELGRGMRYGLGCEIWPGPNTSVGHAGFFPGYMTQMRYWPEHRVAVAVQINTSNPAAMQTLETLCGDLLADVLAMD